MNMQLTYFCKVVQQQYIGEVGKSLIVVLQISAPLIQYHYGMCAHYKCMYNNKNNIINSVYCGPNIIEIR